MGINEIWIPSPNYSSRSTSGIRLLVLHTTEGVQKIRDLGYFFQGNVGASSHSGSDNYENFVFGAYVDENDSAWTQCNYNGACIALEQCTPSGAAYNWSRDYWLGSYERLLRNSAMWVAHMAGKWNIPIVSLSPSAAQSGGRGVCDHVDLGPSGCGHGDCGPGYPMDKVIQWAKEYQNGQQPETGGSEYMSASADEWDGEVYFACVGVDNRVYYKGPDTDGQWRTVDENSAAKSGADILVTKTGKPAGKVIITYTNTSGNVCTYERASGGGGFTWSNRGGNAR